MIYDDCFINENFKQIMYAVSRWPYQEVIKDQVFEML